MNMKRYLNKIAGHPLGVLYGTLLGIVAFAAAVPMFTAGMYDAALVDLAMAAILIVLMLKNTFKVSGRTSLWQEKCAAWAILILADVVALLPTHNFAGGISSALAFSLLVCASVLYFGGTFMATVSIVPTLWCCVFMPYHEEIMLLLSFPLRLSAAAFSSVLLNLAGIGVVHSGTSLTLPGVNIAITDACSGINQLDAFILIAFAAIELLHRKTVWKILHFTFMIPAVIAGNSLRIVLTVLLYRFYGDAVFENSWHTVLGYTQIVFALLIFFGVGKIFTAADKRTEGEES